MWPQSLLSLVLVVLLVGVNAFFVAAEYSIVRVRRTRLEELAGEGIAAAQVTILCVDQLGASLATTQLAVTAASLGVGWLGEGAVARLLSLAFPGMWASGATLHLVASGAAFTGITLIHVVLGEMVPKNMALGSAEKIALWSARPLWLCRRLVWPVIWAFTGIATAITRLLGYRGLKAPPLSEEELRLVLKESHEGGVVTASEAQIIHRAFEFADKTGTDLLIPAEDVQHLALSRSIEDNIAVATRSQHTRLPLCQDGLDSVIGIVHMKDAWPLLAARRSNDALQEASRPVTWIDPATPQDQILELLKKSKAHMGCVRDARGGPVLGLITLEEVLEALLGDLREGKAASAGGLRRDPR